MWSCFAAAFAAAGARAADVQPEPLDLSGIAASRCIAGNTAAGSPSAYANRGAVNAFNGSGIADDGTCGVTANDAMFMLSSNHSGSFPWYIQVDLGKVVRLDGVKLYNFNFAAGGKSYTERGVREFKLFVSTGDTWKTSAADIQSNYSLVLSNRLARATGTADYEGQYFRFDRPAAARYVALVALDDWDDPRSVLNYNGISEIRLFPAADLPRYSICCVGDSITEGANSSGAANKWTYRTYLAQMLAESGLGDVEWKGSRVSPNSGNELPSEGWSGQNAEQIASKYIANAEGDRADVLMLHAGHNYDATQQSESAIIAAATNAHARIIAAARAQNPNVTVLYAKVVTSGKLPKYSYIPALNEAIGALASELNTAASPIRVVDMADGWDWTVHCIDDKVHPTESGARLMASKWLEALMASPFMSGTDALVEAESFASKGGWAVDPQFVDIMGSPYLLAHGMGEPVADAETNVEFGFPGLVRAWVRTRDWTPDWNGEKPGRFSLAVGDAVFPQTLGVAPPDWGWVDAGSVRVAAGAQTIALKDLTGFEGRCDAVYFTSVAATNPPPNDAASLAAWRAEKRGESAAPEDVVNADLVVVGGGIAGTCAAIAAADAGMSVAIVQDRPMLGGNASDEIRVRTENEGDEFHWIVKAVRNNTKNAEDKKADDINRLAVVESYGVAPHLGWRAYGVETNAQRKIVAVDARHVETGARRRFVAPLYVDATGDGWLGYWAGAEFMLGREAKTEYDEPTHGQDAADTSTMGNSLLWTTKTNETAYVFPSVPWATKISGNRADTAGGWQWEAGLDPEEDTIYDAEMLRDRLFRAIYGSFSNTKAKAGNEKLVFDWVPYIAGKRESRRIVGDYVVREKDIIDHRPFEDAIGIATWSVDLHRKDGNSGFIAATTHYRYGRWWMPYRSLCCRDVPNLFMAGRCASYTHVAFGSSRVMHAGGQQGVAAGYAASLCKKYNCRPREIYRDAEKTVELQSLINKKNEYTWPKAETSREIASVIVDNADASGVEISGEWPVSDYNSDRYGADYLHNSKIASNDLWVRFTPEITSNATYVVSLFWNGDDSRGSAVPVEIVYDGGVVTNLVDMTRKSSVWNAIGTWSFKKGNSGSVRILTIGQKEKTVIADAVKFAIVEELDPQDLDGNSLPDAWERRHFLQNGGVDPKADPDGDGFSNREEYLSGTDPNDPGSPLYLSDFGASAAEISITWTGIAGRTYRVYRSEALDLAAFQPYSDFVEGTNGEMTISLPRSALPSAFYRIRDESMSME
ncbi:MAG: FAD-dependent oxidoreductase [Kiritimatiellae bacterium]|nr:FAD-dependent oxidoreductase [Kiritimatiellia bacterium]